MQFHSYGVGVGAGAGVGAGVGVGVDVGVVVGFTISHTAVTCWVCSPSPVLQSNSRVQQKPGVLALPYTSMFTLSNTAVTCWVCFPSPVFMSSSRVKQKLGVVALPFTSMFILLLVLVNINSYDTIYISTISWELLIILCGLFTHSLMHIYVFLTPFD